MSASSGRSTRTRSTNWRFLMNAGDGASSTIRSTRCGAHSAVSIAMRPPMELPTRSVRSMPTSSRKAINHRTKKVAS